jgi:hypothetical protein
VTISPSPRPALRQTSLRAVEVPLDRLDRTLLEVLDASFRGGGEA